jgi:hypothetical protein
LPDRQLGGACVWIHPFIYIASSAGVWLGSGFAGVCAKTLTPHFTLSFLFSFG